MKKLLLLGIISCFASPPVAWAQVQDGTRYWGGTINIEGATSSSRDSYSSMTSSDNQHTISPELQWGKFVNPTTMVGLGAQYSFSWHKHTFGITSAPNSSTSQSATSQSIGILPFVRKYKSVGERWAVFLHAEIGPSYIWNKSKTTPANPFADNSHNWKYELGVKPGLVYFFPKNNLAIEGYANVLSFYTEYTDFEQDSGRRLQFSTGLSTSFPSYFTIRIAKYLIPKTN
ncbi:hypothetical protein [Persicitalea jodogahamensis]|uniref:Outer membrane protein beta-barrel domain-containing protein n=1 Tax=Persicitalea jodogahamensis TaxID=402147 RepID=A0A8J3D5J9_9BACT|nr:hypothetical protein [Persicitalea jodogahamensis]GHB56315.1 hypothetical protein GCM10007390_07050 [Persicitalea jodogahamensis]